MSATGATGVRRRARLVGWAKLLAGAGLSTLWLTGCSGALIGDWHLVEAIPNRETFSLDNVTFRRDGTFSAVTTVEGLTNNEQGEYDFNGWKLRLRPRAGGQRSYSAWLKATRLELRDGQRKVVLQKGKRG